MAARIGFKSTLRQAQGRHPRPHGLLVQQSLALEATFPESTRAAVFKCQGSAYHPNIVASRRPKTVLAFMIEGPRLQLRDRSFCIASAKLMHSEGLWAVEVEAVGVEIDDEFWCPRLYHQGLRLETSSSAELPGLSVVWSRQGDTEYPHPEGGFMYVFGHEQTRDCTLRFGAINNERIEFLWTGVCDVSWDEEFAENVPFRCLCFAALPAARLPWHGN
ncbi:MAG: hypothetical protein KDI37_14445 [Xanthomonadales bacterium]|nr:hypothetical protein [Xanthomonadales bacterium]